MEFRIFLPEDKSTDACLFVFFFPGGDRTDPAVLECHERAHSNGNKSPSALFK